MGGVGAGGAVDLAEVLSRCDPVVLPVEAVDDDGELVALTVDDGQATQQYALSDWNQIEPAEAPEEVAE